MLDYTINESFGQSYINSWGSSTTHTGATVTWNDASTAAPANNSKFRVENNSNYASINMPRVAWHAIYPDITPVSSQGSVLVKMVMPSSAQTIMATGVYLRAGLSGRYYEITYTSWNNRLRIRVWNTSSFGTGTNIAELNSVAFTPVRGEYYWMRVDFSDSGIYAKCWRANNTAEPSGWTVSTTGNNYSVNRVGVIGYHEHSANQTLRVSNFMFRHTSGAANATTSTTVMDTFNDYRRFDTGRSFTRHDWHGDHSMSPTFYQGNRSAGNMVTNVASGVSNAYMTVRRGVAVNRIDHSWIGPNYTNGNVYIHFMFESVVGRLSVFGRATGGVSSGNATIGSAYRVMVYASSSFAIYEAGLGVRYASHGLSIQPNVEYKLQLQFSNGRAYARLWSGNTAPDEWVKLGVINGAVSSSGKFGFRTENQAAYNGYRVYDYSSETYVYKNIIRVYANTRAIKFTMNKPSPRRRRRVSTTPRKMSMTLSAYPLRVKRSTVNAHIENTLSYESIRRLNLEGYQWVGGIWTKINHVPNLNMTVKKVTTPLRVRKTSITRAIKMGAIFSGRRVRKSVVNRSIKFTLDWIAQVIPDNEANLDATFGLSFYSVISKGGEAALSSKFGLDATNVLGMTGATDLRARFLLDAQIPGFFVVRAFGDIRSDMTVSNPLVNFVDTAEAELRHNLTAYGLVQTIHFGSLDVLASFGADFKTSRMAVGAMSTNIQTRMKALGIRSYLNTFDASMTTGYRLDRPDFEITFKEMIERRASFIHYACTYHNREELVIRYRHTRTMNRSSVTYFIAHDLENDEPLLYGNAINMWDDDIIIIRMSDNVGDDLVQRVREHFELPTEKVPIDPWFFKRPGALASAPRIPEKPFHMRPYHQYVDSLDEVPEPPETVQVGTHVSPTSKTEVEHVGPVRVEDKEN